MPASRSAAATTLAPRSWPSRPGLATRTRMGRIVSNNLASAPSARQLALARDEQHLARAAGEGTIAEPVVRLFDDQSGVETELGEARGRVEANAVRARPPSGWALPRGADRQHARKGIEGP